MYPRVSGVWSSPRSAVPPDLTLHLNEEKIALPSPNWHLRVTFMGNGELAWRITGGRLRSGRDTHEPAAEALQEEAEYNAETKDSEASQAAAAEQQKQQKPRTG